MNGWTSACSQVCPKSVDLYILCFVQKLIAVVLYVATNIEFKCFPQSRCQKDHMITQLLTSDFCISPLKIAMFWSNTESPHAFVIEKKPNNFLVQSLHTLTVDNKIIVEASTTNYLLRLLVWCCWVGVSIFIYVIFLVTQNSTLGCIYQKMLFFCSWAFSHQQRLEQMCLSLHPLHKSANAHPLGKSFSHWYDTLDQF